MKIAVISLNPGIDRIIYLDTPAKMGTLNRAARTVVSQGSKGANVAIMLKTLGETPDYYTFTGGPLGEYSESFTGKYGIRGHFTAAQCGVRVNTKVIDIQGVCTEFNERGGPVSPPELAELFSAVFDEKYDVAIITGSIPQGVEKHVYNSMITRFNARGTTTVLDCDGEAMKLGLMAHPALIKPNRRELAGILGIETLEDDDAVIAGCRKVCGNYGCDVICTLEGDGSIFVGRNGEIHRVSAVKTELRGFTGAGDTYLAAYIFRRICRGDEVSEALKYASAAAAAKVSLEGTELPTVELIDSFVS